MVSTCKVTGSKMRKAHIKYHCISQDGKGVYGWVNAESIKELSSKAHSDPASVSKGDIVTFRWSGVCESSTAEYASAYRRMSQAPVKGNSSKHKRHTPLIIAFHHGRVGACTVGLMQQM